MSVSCAHQRTILLFPDMSDSFGNPIPQFGTAEYAAKPASNLCEFCRQPLSGALLPGECGEIVSGCAERMRSEIDRDKHAAYVRALLMALARPWWG